MIKKTLLVISGIFFCCAVFPLNNFALNDEIETLQLYMGSAAIIPVNHPAKVVIGNPEIADVASVTRQQVTISPKAAGRTSLVIWDNLGEHSYQVRVFAFDMQYYKERVDDILNSLGFKEVYTKADDDESKVLLLGSVNLAQDRERILSALATMKEKLVDLIEVKELESVVEIDVQVLELDKDSTSTLGFTWPGSVALTDMSVPVTTPVTGLSNVFHLSKFTRSALNFRLDLLIQEGKARILSRPRLACQSGKEAELLVGGEKPVFTTSVAATTGAEGTQVEYKEFGIKLKIKPTVTDKDRIKLGLNVEVSEVGAADTIGPSDAPTAKAYPLTKRTTATELYLNDGQTMAISGLIKEKQEEDVTRVPWLSDLPIIGGAFRKKTTMTGGGSGERGNTELFVMLTPSIVSTKEGSVKKEAKQIIEEKDPVSIKPAASYEPVIPGPVGHYTRVIQKRILDNLTYPQTAKDSGFHGTVKVNLHLAYSGDLLDVGLKQSSGYRILDDNVIDVAKSISKYPPFPPSIDKKDIWVEIPIDYRLD